MNKLIFTILATTLILALMWTGRDSENPVTTDAGDFVRLQADDTASRLTGESGSNRLPDRGGGGLGPDEPADLGGNDLAALDATLSADFDSDFPDMPPSDPEPSYELSLPPLNGGEDPVPVQQSRGPETAHVPTQSYHPSQANRFDVRVGEEVAQRGVVSNFDQPHLKRVTNPFFTGAEKKPDPSGPAQLSVAETEKGNAGAVDLPVPPELSLSADDEVELGNRDDPTLSHPAQSGSPPLTRVDCPPSEMARAARHLEYGNVLARRGATASARDEFVQTLATVAEGRDAVVGDDRHSRSLKSALQILEELADFYRGNNAGNSVTDTAFVIGTHNSGLISADQSVNMTRLEATGRYAGAIQQNLYEACGPNPVCSAAISSIGKLHSILLKPNSGPQEYDLFASIALHEAAMLCDRNNSRSMNELGVLHARSGNLDLAKNCFISSLRMRPSTEAWRNLATTHQQIASRIPGPDAQREMDLARMASVEASRLSAGYSAFGDGQLVQWIQPEHFSSAPAQFQSMGPSNGNSPAPERSASVAPEPEKSGGFGGLFRR